MITNALLIEFNFKVTNSMKFDDATITIYVTYFHGLLKIGDSFRFLLFDRNIKQ